MKNLLILLAILTLCIVGGIACSCSGRLDITQDYAFDLQVMPYPKRIAQDETVEIRCQIVREGYFDRMKFVIRYFQPDGKGELRLGDGMLLVPNDYATLTGDAFRLYYTSRCNDRQTIDVYVESPFGRIVRRSFDFSNEDGEKKE
ncbi:MAG: DUF3872 domain-containing protein [Bacteroidales bacterium]|nr:DUF3872 domain-containing protein [Bacteroidales bacterium]